MEYNSNDLNLLTQGEQQGTQSRQPACPYCRSTETEFFSLFGQQLLTVQYYCNTCHTPFEYVKDDDVLEAYTTYTIRKEDQA